MRYEAPSEPGWYWAASMRHPLRAFPVRVIPPAVEAGTLGRLRYTLSLDEEYECKNVADAPDHLIWGPRIQEPKFSVNPQWESA